MVYFSNRETKILRLMTQKPEGVANDELVRLLDVSKRTVYRELSLVEETLKSFNLRLSKEGKLYKIEGQNAAYKELVQQLKEPLDIEWVNVEERQSALLATIALSTQDKFTQTNLAELFNVSLTTIQQDLTQLNRVLAKYNIEVKRTKDAQLDLTGNEVYIRLYLTQILSNEINAFDFFQVLKDQSTEVIETESQYLLALVDTSALQMVYRAFASQQKEILNNISDDVLMKFVLLIVLSLMRLRNNQGITTAYTVDHNQLFPYMQQILSIVKLFQQSDKEILNIMELSFFAMQLRGMNVRQQHSIFQNSYDMELAYNIKYLIRIVSEKFQFNFNQDDVLYHDLINHIGAALKRLDLNLPEIENTVLTKLKEEYAVLYTIVEEKLIEVFSPNIFSEQEIGYVVTHFASSYVKYGHKKDINVLVVCTSGIGTSKILKTRIEQAFPEIKEVDVIRSADLISVEPADYEMILSTIVLPDFEREYTLINPILDDKELQTIGQQLKQQPRQKTFEPSPAYSEQNKAHVFDQVKQLVQMTNTLVEDFEVIEVKEKFNSLSEYLDTIFANHTDIKEKVIKRLENSPLAIPETGIMLLHTTDDQLKQPMLKLHHLKHSVTAMGMDHQVTQVNRIMMMMGTENMDDLTKEFLGAISSSIIEKEAYTTLYQKGTTEELRNLLKTISVDVLENQLKKEG